jgi:hypothetical protein
MSALNAIPQFGCLTGTLLPVAIPHVVSQDLKPEVYDALTVGFERAIDAYLQPGRYHSWVAALHNWTKTPSNSRGFFHAVRGRRPLPNRFVYKELSLSLAPGYVPDALPDSRTIYIVHDGHDRVNSLVRMYIRAIWMWKAMVRRCHERFSQSDVQESSQVMVLKYEDLVRVPQQHGAAILDHLGGSPTQTFKRHLGGARTGSVGKHPKRTDEEIQAAEKIAGVDLTPCTGTTRPFLSVPDKNGADLQTERA